MNIEQIIRECLPQVVHMSLATYKDNNPWVCEVHYAYDDLLSSYTSNPSQKYELNWSSHLK